jgi:hypothetical protein
MSDALQAPDELKKCNHIKTGLIRPYYCFLAFVT